jgi:hypothetical protein
MSSPNLPGTSVVGKRSFGFAGLAAVGACAAVCSLPLLAAAGIGGGALATLAGYVRPGVDLLVAAGVGAGVLAIMAVRTKKARRSAGNVVSAEAGCGCGQAMNQPIFASAEPTSSEPIVCTADLRDMPTIRAQMDGYRAAFTRLQRTERFAGGFRWVFEPAPGLDEQLRTLAANEHRCCRFFKFEVRRSADALVWETTAHEHAAKVSEEFAELPAMLGQTTPGRDLLPIKQRVSAAGLVFAADSEHQP